MQANSLAPQNRERPLAVPAIAACLVLVLGACNHSPSHSPSSSAPSKPFESLASAEPAQAAAHLFPKPRDLRAGRFRLVSTQNNVPTREDLHSVLARGMPGPLMLTGNIGKHGAGSHTWAGNYKGALFQASPWSITRNWMMPMHQTDSLFHKRTGAMAFVFGFDVDNHAINTVLKETLIRITKTESGGLGGVGVWKPAESGFSPGEITLANQAYLTGAFVKVRTRHL